VPGTLCLLNPREKAITRRAVITGTGLYTPPQHISNQELCDALEVSVERYNRAQAGEIAEGTLPAREHSSDAFILKASGIRSRYVLDKTGVLDPERMYPRLPLRSDDELSIQAEISVAAVEAALKQAGRAPGDVDALLVGCSNLQRAYPAVAIEVQHALGARGYAYDLNVACSSATFALQAAADAVRTGSARCVAVVNPEITSGHNNFELRDHHFIFGDACTATIVEDASAARAAGGFEILSTRLETAFSNNIRNNFGFLNRSEEPARPAHDVVFNQNGRQVFREVCPLVSRHIQAHLAERGVAPRELRRMWLHQANLNMNRLIATAVLGHEPSADEAPVILDEYANTSSAGCVIAFHKFRDDFRPGELGLLCSFGAGYSVGSVLVRSCEDPPR
jgi:beta-ketodecanoyl-[acyl-carrier-protein] synthase